MYNLNMNIDSDSVKVIKIRIIELTNKKINLDSQLREVINKIDLEEKETMLRELNRHRKILTGKIIEVEKMLFLNKQLLNQTNEHEYQLEN